MAPPGSSASTASSVTLSVPSPSLDVDHSKTIPDGHSASESEPTPVVEYEQATRAVWLAPTPVRFITDLRYSRRDKLDYDEVEVIETVPPVNGLGPATLGTLGWKAYEHPEGSVYFRAENFYTNLWLYDTATLEAIEKVVEKIRRELASLPEFKLLGKDIEFGVDLVDDDEPGAATGDKLGCYYVVDKTSQEAFWLHEVSSSFYCDGAELKIISCEHLRYGAKMGYWWVHPHARGITATCSPMAGASPQIQSGNCAPCFPTIYLTYRDPALQDKTTSTTSATPYSEDDAHRLFKMFREMEVSAPSGRYVLAEHVVMIARMQFTFREPPSHDTATRTV
ncbi:hypothetical protein V8D89_012321 [Ganoderma adspersum]